MFDEIANPGVLQPQELEAVYAISRAVANSENVEAALDQVIQLSRPVFIFDSMVVYSPGQDGALEPAYARLIGRGQSAEGDLAWGDSVGFETYKITQTLIRREEREGWQHDRLNLRFFLGLPLKLGDQMIGALVFGRYGGPPYTPEQIHLAEFIAAHTAQLLGHKQLVARVANLEAERKLDQLQKDFIATISHELCTPLGFIKGYATTLLREDTTWDDTTKREFLQIIDEEADKLRELIDNLLDSSRLQSGTLKMQLQPTRIDSLLKDISVRNRSRNENLSIQLNINRTDLRCQVDPTRIAQVMDNLISNALKYAPGSEIAIGLDLIDSQVRITVHDNGPGIAPEHLEHLFKRFYRVPDKAAGTRGTGLGLFICRQIIQAHGGEIQVQSTLGKGTTFIIALPYGQNQPFLNQEAMK
ncbi:MAG: sensor histidine kinase [Omnitrophica WOR_2 bacterium]